MQIDLTDHDDPASRAAISAQLNAYNAEVLGLSPRREPIAVVLRDADANLIGGAWGTLGFGWLSVDMVFVAKAQRGHGLGRRLLHSLEHAGWQSGVRGMRTMACSYQSPGFFVARGYTEYARLQDCPPGHCEVSLIKRVPSAGDGGLEVLRDPDPALRAELRANVTADDTEIVGPLTISPLFVVVRTPDQIVCGGLAGHTKGGWLHVEQFALPPALRGGGIGSRLLTMAHEAAIARGMTGAKLATGSYQARPFYEKLGYSVYGTISDYQDGGHSRFLLARPLTGTAG
jgi:GNAT superfamily N-acetyltransferase